MRKLGLVLAATMLIMSPAAWSFAPGEHVTIGSTKQTGTVLEDKGNIVKVHIDSSGYSADVGVWFDKEKDSVISGVASVKANSVREENNGSQNLPGNISGAASSYKSGSHVKVGSTGQTGTVLEDRGSMVKVHIDNSGYSADVGVWFTREQLLGKADAATGATTAASAPSQAPNNNATSAGNLAGTETQPKNTGGAGNQTKPNQINNAYNADKGVGAPPDGVYTCNKISGSSYIHIGTIEIKGGTYKGFSSQQGSFHPFSIDGSGSIVWSAGLTGLPDGWTLKPGKYVGLDYRGRPLIRVYYNSARGAAEVVDATKEK